ncbi:NAD-dependent dehydratase [Lottiidibacillus patelloidae]|uniref:NAD-dependent dehydratase n=1 Tax=Lottiidibacillus patelloidae TaxID=2670334 RepID=A0A263BT27_9BACI|nr:NAD-dependent epimerase/dehydratase family protein [Lottiidibacillus patelloidae]OZM56849.1 NAD-dependent dehydratase [Lottiidibacillus patelloidae]
MKTALVFGGTRFFGVNLVNALIKQGVKVTIATRGETPDDFGDKVERLMVDRFNDKSVNEAVEGRNWDVVFDQLCFSSEDAKITVAALTGKIKRYIFTSTMSVYPFKAGMKEEDFNPYTYELKMVRREDVDYQEGKRQAEAYFFQKASFPVVAVRIPIVMGEEDYTKRLLHYVTSIKEGKEVYLPNPEAKMCFIHQKEAGDFLAWTATQDFTGPINACATGEITMQKLMEEIAKQTGKEVKIVTDQEMESPYGLKTSWSITNEKAQKLGYPFTKLNDWLPQLLLNLQQKES